MKTKKIPEIPMELTNKIEAMATNPTMEILPPGAALMMGMLVCFTYLTGSDKFTFEDPLIGEANEAMPGELH